MSQYVRDARIAMIYEGANGIQALDLVGRKLALNGGRAVMALFKEIGDFCEENRTDEKLVVLHQGSEEGLERPAGRHHVVHAATPWQSPTMPAPARPTTCTSSVSSSSATCGRRSPRRRRKTWRPATGDREDYLRNKLITAPLLHGAHHAGNGAAQGPHRNRRRHDDGAGCGGVLIELASSSPAGRGAQGSDEEGLGMRGLLLLRPYGTPSHAASARPLRLTDAVA